MMIHRRTFLPIVMSAFSTTSLLAQPTWPTRGVKFITPSQPGGSPDIVARLFGEALASRWNQTVITENRAGADGSLAVAGLRDAVSSESPTLLVAPTNLLTVTQVIRERPSFSLSDVEPVSLAASDFLAVAVPSSSAIRSLDDLLAAGLANPGKLNWFAVPGGPFMVFSDWLRRRQLQMTYISYRGGPDAIRDLGENRIQAVMAPLVPLLPLVSAGKVRLLVVSNPDRSSKVPEVPTVAEAGHAELALEGSIAFFAPRGLSLDNRRKIAADITAVAQDPRIADRLRLAGQVAKASSPEALQRTMAEQAQRWHQIAKDLQIVPT